MMNIEWLKAGVFFGSMLYAVVGVVVFWLCFVVVDKLTPYDLWAEIIEKKNVALAIVVGSMCIAIGLIVSAAVHRSMRQQRRRKSSCHRRTTIIQS